MKKKLLLIGSLFVIFGVILSSYLLFFNESEAAWNDKFQHVLISSSMDEEKQDAYFYSSTEEKPLIVSLHQWSHNYEESDPLSEYVIEFNWNYIRPNARGVNDHSDACGGPLVISDIDDAIQYAIDNGNVDIDNIHVVGASGGGYTALQHLMLSDIQVKSYNAWVPITDLIAWYGQSKVRDNKYSEDILQCTDSKETLDIENAKKRSPLHQDTPLDKIKDTNISIFAGINDGFDGSVPISHSVKFYNKIVNDLGYDDSFLVPDEILYIMLHTQQSKEQPIQSKLGDRDVLYQMQTENVFLKIFDGDHEILEKEAINLLIDD